MLIPVASADGSMTGRVTAAELVRAAMVAINGTGGPASAPSPYNFLSVTLNASNGNIGAKVANASDGSPVSVVQLGIGTSASSPPAAGGVPYANAPYYNNGAGEWTTYVNGAAASLPSGNYYVWAKMADGVDRLAGGPYAK